HSLIDAFEATLQEAAEADLLLHVVDASNPDFPEQLDDVQKVLKEIGADQVPQILVFNKIDRMADAQRPRHLLDSYDLQGVETPRVFISAQAGLGLTELRAEMARQVALRADMPPGGRPVLDESQDPLGTMP
ncbi:MAG: GTPase HflX, partial [Burkholderiaceae bacterium]